MKFNVRDAVSGLLISLFGLYFFASSFSYGLGSLARMGPGMFPMLVGALTVLVGVFMALPGLRSVRPAGAIEWRPVLAVLGSVIVFSFAFMLAGLLPAVFLAICTAAVASKRSRPFETAALGAGTALVCWLVFIEGLGMQIPALGGL